MKSFSVWSEGYAATGESSPAEFLGVFEGKNFKDACYNALVKLEWDLSYYNSKSNSYWACRFYDNEIDARKNFG